MFENNGGMIKNVGKVIAIGGSILSVIGGVIAIFTVRYVGVIVGLSTMIGGPILFLFNGLLLCGFG